MRSGDKRARVLGGLALVGIVAGVVLVGASVVNHARAQDGGSAPLPDCPPPGSLGPGTPLPGPDNVSWSYIQECSHCLAVTPGATGLPLGPTSTAVMRSFHTDCARDYVFQLPAYQILADNTQETETYGVIFTPHNTGLMIQAAMADDPQVTWLMPLYSPQAGTYLTNDQPVCLVVAGYEYLCGQFAPPGAEVRSMGYLPDGAPYIPHPSYSRPLALGINAGGDITVSDVRVITFGSTAYACDPPTPTPVSSGEWAESCPFDLGIPQSGGFTHYEQPVGGTVGGVSWSGPSPVAGYVFYMFTQGAEVTIGPAVGGPSFFDTSLAGYEFEDGYYCLGTYDACAVLGPDSPFTWLENSARDVAATTYYLPFNIIASDSRTIMLDNGYWIARGTWPPCEAPEPTPTPYPTWTPVPPLACISKIDVFEAGSSGTKIATRGYVQISDYEQSTWSTLTDYSYGSWMTGRSMDSQFLEHSLANGYLVFEIIADPGNTISDLSASKHNGAGSQPVTDVTYLAGGLNTGYVKVRFGFGVSYPYFSRLSVTGSSEVGVNVGWTVRLLECSGGVGYMTPTPDVTTTLTPSPSATWTPVVSPTPTATLADDPDRCREWDWKTAYPPVVDIGDDFGEGLLEEGECYGFIPGMHISVPDLGPVGDLVGWDGAQIEWEAFGYCVTWVNLPEISILGLGISMDWFLLPAVAWLLNKLVEMS